MEKITTTEFIYEVARLEAIASERRIVPEIWEKRDEAFKKQMTEYVEGLRGKTLPTPEEAHNSWWRKYEEMGWKYGEVRDIVAKTHPDMVPFNELPKDERDKDEVFLALVDFAFKYIPFKDTKEGQTHYFGDGCGMPEHNNPITKKIKERDEILIANMIAFEEITPSDEKPYKRPQAIISHISTTNKELIQSVIDMVEGMKKPDDYEAIGADIALQDLTTKLKEVLKDMA